MFSRPALTWILLTSLLLSVSNGSQVQAQSQAISIPDGTEWIEPIKGTLMAIQTKGNSTNVILDFTLRGCDDRLLPLITSIEQQNGKVRVYITALNARRKGIDCHMRPPVSEKIQIPGRHRRQNIQIIFLKSQPS
jgi:hypothetical protein